jgi:hypothetical protein
MLASVPQVCTPDGTICDIVNLVPYIQKFGRHPVTGQPLALRDIVQLKFHKNADGEYQCPVLNKVFTESTHIVAIKATGNVYCWEVGCSLGDRPACVGASSFMCYSIEMRVLCTMPNRGQMSYSACRIGPGVSCSFQ